MFLATSLYIVLCVCVDEQNCASLVSPVSQFESYFFATVFLNVFVRSIRETGQIGTCLCSKENTDMFAVSFKIIYVISAAFTSYNTEVE